MTISLGSGRGEDLATLFGDEDEVLDAHAEVVLEVDARLNRNEHPRLPAQDADPAVYMPPEPTRPTWLVVVSTKSTPATIMESTAT